MSLVSKAYHRLQKSWRITVNMLAARIGIYTGFYRNARGARIIVYHGIVEKKPLRFNTLFVTRTTFEKHLRFYRRYCELISLDAYFSGRFNKDRFNICISFDDGFAGAYRHALPLLEKYQVPATFFITGIRNTGADILWNDFLSLVYPDAPDKIRVGPAWFRKRNKQYREIQTGTTLNAWLWAKGFGEKKEWMDAMWPYAFFRNDPSLRDYWLQMDLEEIKKLSDSPLITIGSHGYYHNDLANDDQATLCFELENSRQFLEQLTGKQLSSVAFPYGSYSPQVIDAAKQAGYRQLLATDFLSENDGEEPLLRERMMINPFIGAATQLRAIIKGHYA
jgi:peptidoglycan/xylan/chitin deacetylase (PgdA/CDA1 family)